MAVLKKEYDLASNLAHTNRMTYAQHLSVGEGGKGKFTFQDIPKAKINSLLPTYLLWMCHVHVAVLHCVDLTFAGFKSELSDFRHERKYVGDRIKRFRDSLPKIDV